MYFVFTPKSGTIDESIQGFDGCSIHISTYISSLTLYNEKFTRDLDRFLANISTPRFLKWTLSRWKYAGIEGHGSIHKILFWGSDLLTRIEFKLSIILSVGTCRRHGGTWLMKTDACGQCFLTSSIRQSYWKATLSTGCVSRSFPPHWSTTFLGLAPVENIWFSLDLIWGIVAPGYVSVVASTPYCLRRLLRPRTRDEPITNVSETAGWPRDCLDVTSLFEGGWGGWWALLTGRSRVVTSPIGMSQFFTTVSLFGALPLPF